MTFALASPAFHDRSAIPAKFTCDAADVSPPLAVLDPPPRTLSLAVICDDPDAPVRQVPSTMLLGRLFGRVDRGLSAADECTALGWFLGQEGRKYHVGTAIHTRAGELVAVSRATWIALK